MEVPLSTQLVNQSASTSRLAALLARLIYQPLYLSLTSEYGLYRL
jgi:hypothetical protein